MRSNFLVGKLDEIVRNFENVEDDVTVMTDDELRDELLSMEMRP